MAALCLRLAGNFKMQFNDFKQFPLFVCNPFAVSTISSYKEDCTIDNRQVVYGADTLLKTQFCEVRECLFASLCSSVSEP